MLIKLIHCRVDAKKKSAFHSHQRRWAALHDAPGFLGQLGGWCSREPDVAKILGLWRDRDAHDHFMTHLHDAIAPPHLSPHHSAIEITLLSELLIMPGASLNLRQALLDAPQGALLRLARCHLHPHRTEHFEAAQRAVWRPGMRDTHGMLGGSFARSPPDASYLVATLWTSPQTHDRYAAQKMPALRAQADAQDDLLSIQSGRVPLSPHWTVLPS